MECYLTASLYAILVGLYDYTIKGTAEYKTLGELFKGWSWHTAIFALFVASLVFKASASHDWRLMYAVPAFINEDATFYLLRSAK